MAIDKSRQGQRVRNTLTGKTAVIEYHSDGYIGEQDHYLVTLDEPMAYGVTQDWWKSKHIAARGILGEIASTNTKLDVQYEIQDIIELIAMMNRRGRSIEAAADDLDLMTTALEFEHQGEAHRADEGVLRAVVQDRLTPDRMVAIPGLGRSVPVYS